MFTHDNATTDTPIALKGTVERVVFHNPENGFCVLKVIVDGFKEAVSMVGNAAQISANEYIECLGQWHQDKTYGRQFKTHSLVLSRPNDLDDIEKYLGSGLIHGIGPHYATLLVHHFGSKIFDILDNEPQRLTEMPGLGKKRQKQILDSWAEQKQTRDIMFFLHSHGITTARAVRIYKTYGDQAISTVKEDPFRLMLDIPGMGFKAADEIASRIGLATDSQVRAQAGVRYVLQLLCEQGHCALTYQQLVNESVALLAIDESIIKLAIEKQVLAKHIVVEEIENSQCVFPALLHQAESIVAERLLALCQGKTPWGEMDVTKEIPLVEEKTGIQLAESQVNAIKTVLANKVAIMTGGPGVGKTTIVNSIVKMIRGKFLSIALCAPTGRAAKRLNETTGLTAKTIHRLLGFTPDTQSFKHDKDHPLPVDVLIVDEVSMVDITLLQHLLLALPDHAAILFVGDVDQLPSVGSGAVLMDMIQSELIHTVRLTEIFRQAANSNIIINAHRINQGEIPLPNEKIGSDFYTIYADSPEKMQQELLSLISERIPKFMNCDPIADIQVLTPMNRGALGSVALNVLLQTTLNCHAEPKLTRQGLQFAPGDKVIQTVNNYEKEVFNGDIGFVSQVNLEKSILKVSFDHKVIEYDLADVDEITLAYAISIHKSQGSEFPVVIMLLSTQHYALLARNLLYTGVTRGKRLVVLIGEKRAVQLAVKNNRENKRITKLAQRLRRNPTAHPQDQT